MGLTDTLRLLAKAGAVVTIHEPMEGTLAAQIAHKDHQGRGGGLYPLQGNDPATWEHAIYEGWREVLANLGTHRTDTAPGR